MEKYYIQNRWVLKGMQLTYYGLRNKENLFKNRFKISKKQQRILELLPKDLTDQERKILKPFIGVQVGNFIGGAYIPSKHTYKANRDILDLDKLLPLCIRLESDQTKVLPKKRPKNIFADFFPSLRSRLAVSIKKNNNCNNCNLCSRRCPVQAIDHGRINKNCLRCLRCYYECPRKGLTVKYSLFLKLYLRKEKINKLIIY